MLRRGEAGYPGALLSLEQPPERLFWLGDPGLLRGAPDALVAIVGTRDATPYGLRVAADLARAFCACGIGVVSGLARGIDAAAHRATLAAGGQTIAVLGTGVDVPYPTSHRSLHAAIAGRGLVLSESEPGTKARKGCFPRRNRIIAALARVTIVVEAPFGSGAINTAKQALDLGRTVAAVPGQIDSVRSAASNELLRDGAHVIASVDDAVGLCGVSRKRTEISLPGGEVEERVWRALEAGGAAAETISARSGLPARQVLEGLARLELGGLVRQSPEGEMYRSVPS